MITKQHIRKLERRVDELEQPVLSLYAQVARSDAHTTRVRATETMTALEVPEDLQRRVISTLDVSTNRAPTVALFADRDAVEVMTVPMELPVIDPQTGHVEARYGEPYLTPLLLALDEQERYAAILVDRDRARTFEVFLGEIEEVDWATREPSGIEAEGLQLPKQAFPDYIPSRDDAAKDRATDRTREWMRRFYDEVAGNLSRMIVDRGIDRLLLLGPEREVAMFENLLPTAVSERVAAKTTSLPDPEASPPAVLEKLRPTLRRLEEERTRAIVDRVKDEGVRSVDACLTALQHGRLHTVVAAWGQETTVFENEETGVVATSEEEVRGATGGKGMVRTRPLVEVLPRLANDFGARLTFVRGSEGDRVVRELGGIGGLPRW